ncbi:hypothetical protein FOXG_14059 [Fusarium oxysporum f. sp. lycopersici 4287]|uniref:Uncharacterized protein n=1 Tax=Fusarium oxysporum f. sp. lycopersici (strain 4287 / CBS 123668 / FGSC 9935 / NRRL 34936) TaxID=426428 RepID=A0A0J9VXN1_FUSO4|nr:hypothetical protein FOXG_12479 [Fusarium oxysporum f. sp. lycopersici 4287]XP_018253603.1 hypothetical protein FOXG_14059 [Fusarium oxysporum f. sp. lycopersici 4287]EWZ79216.1 hypothetical protein FOWG_16660 [Fusarium oxysporum f. sp. lycopersici MN25]KAJ9413033.1 hypothetical protein QL093DRAFT_2108160 [Fusarium oxysporum]KNB13791.1 hypothetical protein FOXG_12479 [Fusarium oxysporum f. sp. lycopersici 4287]KNB15558.1 hypothetical protein FOXG_14059 [Fusarium oxysporum f. sp. lycopersici
MSDRTDDFRSMRRAPPKRRSAYASLKSKIDEVIDSFRGVAERQHAQSLDDQCYEDSIDFQHLLPYSPRSHVAPKLVADANELSSLCHRSLVSESMASSASIIYKPEDPWLKRLDEMGRSEGHLHGESRTSSHSKSGSAHSFAWKPLPSTSQASQASGYITRPGSCPPVPGHQGSARAGRESKLRFSLPPKESATSQWSDSEDGMTWMKGYKRRLSRIKSRATRYFREFVLDEDEQEFFHTRRSMALSSGVNCNTTTAPLRAHKQHARW